MYQTILIFHSFVRWLVVACLIYSILRAYKGYISKSAFNKTDNLVRHCTATVAHIQLVIGCILYGQSPVVRYFFANFKDAMHNIDVVFFGLIHIILMLTAIVLITVGSALSKRKQIDHEKFKTMLVWSSISLILIFIAIPWPFSPLANRPYFR